MPFGLDFAGLALFGFWVRRFRPRRPSSFRDPSLLAALDPGAQFRQRSCPVEAVQRAVCAVRVIYRGKVGVFCRP